MRFDDREAWLRWRAEGIGASDVPAILSLSRFGSPWSVWAEKCGLLPLDEDSGELADAGRFLELAIGPWVAHRTGLRVDAEQDTVEHASIPWARSTLDGLLFDGGGATPVGNLEIKTRQPGKDEPPDVEIVSQCRWQQFVGGYERTLVAILRGRRLDLHWVERDEAEIEFIYERVAKFWNDHVLTGEPPETDDHEATTRALAAVYGEPEPESHVDLDPDRHAELIDGWLAAKQQAKDAEALVDHYANALRAVLGDRIEGHLGGVKRVSWKPQTRRGVDMDRLRADHPSIVAAYETVSEHRVLRHHAAKEPKA